MRTTVGRRKVQLLVAVLVAGGSLQLLTGSMTHVVVAEPTAAPATHPALAAPPLPSNSVTVLLGIAHRTSDAAKAGELFAPHSWYTPPPPAPPPSPAPAAAPVAPPLPYTLLGSYTNSENTTVYFVARDDRVYDVKPGDVLDQNYSVVAVENGQLVFIYKPLDVRQSLPLGATP